MHLNDKTEA